MDKTLIEKDLGAELMLYDPVRDEVHVLNPTARLIYRLCREGKRLEEIEATIRGSFRLQADRDLSRDVGECLSELQSKGLIPEKE